MSRKEDIQKLIINHNLRLQKLKEKQALKGIAAEPELLVEIEEIEKTLQKSQAELEEIEQSEQELPSRSPNRIPFTNQEDEIKLVLSSYAPAYYLLDAPAGYGKTELLKELERRFEEQDWRCVYVPVEEKGTLADLTTRLAGELSITLDQTPDLPWSVRLGSALPGQWEKAPKEGLALLIDLEKKPSPAILKALLEEFIPDIQSSLHTLDFFKVRHNRFRVILAGRYLAAALKEIDDPPLPLKLLALSPFDHNVIRNSAMEYLAGVNNEDINQLSAHLFYLTGGHPGCLAQILKLYKQQRMPPDRFLLFFKEKIWEDIVCWVVANIHDGTPKDSIELHSILDRLSIFRCLDYFILRHTIEESKTLRFNSEYKLADELTATYLLSWKDRFLRDDITRRLLVIKLRHEKPTEFPGRCRQARDVCAKRLQEQNVQRPEIWVIEYLFLSLQQHAAGIQDKKKRLNIRDSFLEKDVSQALKMFINDRHISPKNKYAEQQVLNQEMEADWEFQFTVNYYLREDQYSDEPYGKLKQKIKEFFT